MAGKIISRKFNSLHIGDQVEENWSTYKVVGIKQYVNHTGGTDYVIEETFLSKLKDKFFKKNK